MTSRLKTQRAIFGVLVGHQVSNERRYVGQVTPKRCRVLDPQLAHPEYVLRQVYVLQAASALPQADDGTVGAAVRV